MHRLFFPESYCKEIYSDLNIADFLNEDRILQFSNSDTLLSELNNLIDIYNDPSNEI